MHFAISVAPARLLLMNREKLKHERGDSNFECSIINVGLR